MPPANDTLPRQSSARQRPSLSLILGLAAVLLGLSVWLIGWVGGSDALLPNAWGSTSQQARPLESPPYIGLEVRYQDDKPRANNGPDALWVRHLSTKLDEQRGQLVIHLENRSSTTSHAVFYLSQRGISLSPGDRVVLSGEGELKTTDKQTEAGLGFHALDEQGRYLTEITGDRSMLVSGMDGRQLLEQSHERPPMEAAPRPAITTVAPRLAIYNIAPGAKVDLTLKWSPAVVSRVVAPTQLSIDPWPSERSTQPHATWRVDVFGTGSPALPAQVSETLALYRGNSLVFESAPQSTQAWRTAGAVRDPWRVALPASLAEGLYEVKFLLRQGEQTIATHPLGALRVSAKAGMLVGMNFHRYPGSGEHTIGALKLNHQLARSFSGDGWNPNVWWQGIDQYGWKGIDAWARFHAPKGEKRLLITFSGTPTWASAAPGQPSSMQLLGYAAPPRKALYPAYGRMVKATLERLQGRVKAVECWNEPDLAEFFTGTSTEMADLCQLVRDNAKALDPDISVICPQTTSVRNLALVLNAKTSDGRALPELCDLIGIHIYGALGDDERGAPYDAMSLAGVVRDVQTSMARHGVHKPTAITEYGLTVCEPRPTAAHPVPVAQMSSQAAGEALYQSLATLQANGVALVTLYSYDEGNNEPGCRPGGSRVRMMEVDATDRQRPNATVVEKFNQAVRDFGAR